MSGNLIEAYIHETSISSGWRSEGMGLRRDLSRHGAIVFLEFA